VSDCDAIADIYGGHHYTDSLPAAAAAGVKAGCDLDCGGAYDALNDAVKQGLITEAEIDVSVKRLFTERMRLGMFDPPAQVAYSQIPYSVIDSPAHRKLAIQAARESMVLLKNEKNTLPFGPKIKSLAVIGPNADDVGVLLGNYNGTPSHAVTALEGLRKHVGDRVHIEYVQGTGLTGLSETTVIPTDALTAGGKPGLQGEYFDNEDLSGMPKGVRQDPQLQFTWSGSGPGLGLTQFHYSVRWTGALIAPADGEYTLAVGGDDGFRLFVNDQKVIDDWGIHPTETKTTTVTLKAGQHIPIRLEYYQAEGDAEISLQWRRPIQSPYADAIAAAKRADAVIFVGGISSKLEGEEGTGGTGDRTSMDLPDVQEKLLEALHATGKPVVLVLMNGSAMSVNWADAHLPAIVEAWYPGEEGGTALADVLFGDYNPAGRLPVMFYKSVDQLPAFTDYAMKARTYRYFNGEPLYPFGYGLSYTQFRYGALTLPRQVKDGQSVTVTAQVENVGSREGDEVSELYLRPAPDSASREIAPGQPMPRLVLSGFTRIHLAPHQRRTVSFTLTPDQLRLVNAKGERILQPSAWQVYVGGHQPSLTKAEGIVSGPLRVQ
jgi:beta-glucosidase